MAPVLARGLALSGNANELAHGGGGPGKGSLSCLTVSPMLMRPFVLSFFGHRKVA